MTKEFISRKTAGNFQKTTSQFAPRPFATPQQKSAKTENSTPQDIQCSPESSNRLSRIAIAQHETFTPQLTVQRAEQVVANDNPGEEAEKIQRSSTGNNRLAKISIQPPEPPSTRRFPIQAKLTVGAAGDKYEQEADRVARQVMNRIHAPQVNLNSSESNPVQRKISIQALGGEGGDVSSEWESELNRARGGGQPLSLSLREPMEREFGADFSGVRVHTGAQADGLARSIQAKAFTTGQDVFFRQGAYEPGSRGGQELIAHELTHVVQQGRRIQQDIKKEGKEVTANKQSATIQRVDTRSGRKRHSYRTRLNQGPVQPGTRRYGRSTTRINNLSQIININLAENLPQLLQTTVMPDGTNVKSTNGYVRYNAIANGRRDGVSATITKAMLRTGTGTGGYSFPFFTRSTSNIIVRAHLLARVLGGSGTEPRNLVPLYHTRNNIPMYRDVERPILEYVEKGNIVNYEAYTVHLGPAYPDPLSLLPTMICIRATDFYDGHSILSSNPIIFDTGF